MNYAHKNQNNFNDIFVPVQLNERIQEKLSVLGDKQKGIDMIFEIGLVDSILLKHFISWNEQSSISFHFSFYQVENMAYMLSHTQIRDELINNIVDSSDDCIEDDFFCERSFLITSKVL